MTDDELKEHRNQLEAAINEALSDSARVSEIVHLIRQGGYEVFLLIEATVGFSRRSEDPEVPAEPVKTTRLELTSQDERFLRALKISPD